MDLKQLLLFCFSLNVTFLLASNEDEIKSLSQEMIDGLHPKKESQVDGMMNFGGKYSDLNQRVLNQARDIREEIHENVDHLRDGLKQIKEAMQKLNSDKYHHQSKDDLASHRSELESKLKFLNSV